jgi:prolyl oligopeptidase
VPPSGTAALRELIGERDAVLTHVVRAGAGFLAAYLVDASYRVCRFHLTGTDLGDVDLGAGISLVGLTGRPGDGGAFAGVTSFVQDTRIYRIDLATGAARLLVDAAPPASTFAAMVTERHRATSRDGTTVPYFLVRGPDVSTDTPQPTLLYGYGGFDQTRPSRRPGRRGSKPAVSSSWPTCAVAGSTAASGTRPAPVNASRTSSTTSSRSPSTWWPPA